MRYYVQNLNGTGNNDVPNGYTSWLDFWEKKANKKVGYCHAVNCSAKAEVGAHVKIVGETNVQYIVPLCKGCNNGTDLFYVDGPLVPINSNNTIRL
ncbi:MAG: hypothetical protein PHO86_05540 [Bacilli bacterium]|nr:hypothetical protein [Bacilli bacterium]